MDGNKPSVMLTDLLDVTYLQYLQDGFAAATKVTCTIVDPAGNRITSPSNWRGVCALCHDATPCYRSCHEKVCELIALSRKNLRPVVSDCPHGPLTTAAVPIVLDGMYLGSWIFGQMIINEPAEAAMERTAKEPGISRYRFSKAVDDLPRYPPDVFDSLFSIVETITSAIVELGKKNMEMAKRDAELQWVTRQLEKRDLVLTQYVQASHDAIYICDYDSGEILIANRALCQLLDLDQEDIVGRNCRDLMHTCIEGFCELCPQQRLLNGKQEPNAAQVREFFHQSQGLWLRATHQATLWGANKRAQMVTIEDVTQEQSMRGQLEKLAYYDNLTGLPNNNKLAMDFRTDLKSYGAPNSHMICFDISPLRLFEDAYGKGMGNLLLKTALEWVHKEAPGNSRLFCLNNYEFCLVPGRGSGVEQVKAYAQRILTRFEKPWQITIGGREMSYVCSIVVSILAIPQSIRRFQELQDLINRTLNSGRNASADIYFYDEDMDRKNHEQIRQVLSLKECLTQGMEGFTLHYQPIVKLSSGLWAGIEALCRWTRPGHETVCPLEFIREAERLGLINELGTWVLDTAVRQTKEIGLDRLDDFFLSVNISPIQMMDPLFADVVTGILEKYQYPGNRLNLEITESAQMTFNTFTMDMITKLRGFGVRLALDDFGTGYSSFTSLKNLPVDFLKTEREFILGIENDRYMQYFFYLMSEIAHATKMKFIAEGIETAEQVVIAKNNGADYIQGYYFSKPLPADMLEQKYERFIVPDSSYSPPAVEVLNIQHWLSGKSAYELTPTLFNLMNRCMLVLLSEKDISSAFQNIFEILGEHFDVSRAFAFIQDEDPALYSNLYEWCNVNIAPQKQILQHVSMDLTPSLLRDFREQGMVIASSMSELAMDMQDVMPEQDVKAVALIPMWDEDELIGFAGFDSTMERAWSPEEIVMLWNMAILMANSVKREKLKLEVVEKKGILDSVLQRSGINAYVADIDTYELLWISEPLKETKNLPADVVGGKCYEVLGGYPEPCAFCKMPEITRTPEGGHVAHKIHSNYTGRDYTAYGGVVQWSGRRKAYINYPMDIESRPAAAKQMKDLASLDMLTGALNRQVVLGKMRGGAAGRP